MHTEAKSKFPLPPFRPEVRLDEYDKLPHLFCASSAQPLPLRGLESLQDEEVTGLLQNLELGYAPTGGHPKLLTHIANYYGAPITEESVLTFPGAQTAIFKSGCVGFPLLKSVLPVEDFAQQLVDGPGVLVMPASVFDFAGNFFRIGFGRTSMPQSLERFKAFVDTNRESW